MSQKKILLITYYFPPLGGAGIGRPLALFQDLPSHDYECHVLTVKPVLYRVYEPELLQELDSSRIFRSGSRDPSRLLYLLGVRHIGAKSADESRNISRNFFPDGKAGWIKPAIRLGMQLVERNNYDLMVSTSPPISAHVIAKELAQAHRIPWVADFRDYWTSHKAEVNFDSDVKKQKAKQLLDEIRNTAVSVTAVNESVGRYVGSDSVISNCYDAKLAKLWKTPSVRQVFTIGVFGTISKLTPIEPLLTVLLTVKRNWPDTFSKIKVLQVGQVDANWLKMKVKEFGMEDIFDIHEFKPREKAIELLSDAALFYIGVAPKIGFSLTTNRIFTLLSSGRPILAYAETGSEVERLVSKYANSFPFDDARADEAGGYLLKKVEEYQKGEFSIDIEPLEVREFSSKQMVEKFVAVFDRKVHKD